MRLDTRAFARKASRVRINDGPFAVVSKGDLSVVFWGTIPLYHFRTDDRVGRYTAAVELVRLHGLGPEAVADAVGVNHRTMYRLLNRFDERGADGLAGRKGSRKPTKIRGGQARRLLELRRRGASHREAASRLGVSKSGVTGALLRLGWNEAQSDRNPALQKSVKDLGEVDQAPWAPASETCGSGATVLNTASQEELLADATSAPSADVDVGCPLQDGPTVDSEILTPAAAEPDTASAPSQSIAALPPAPPSSVTVDVDPLNRQGDRMMAQLGLLDDAVPLFAPGLAPKGGVLLAIPVLIASGIFDIARKVYGSIGPAFYGLRTSVLAFPLLALLRIKRAENLKKVPPQDLGRLLGLDRAPEMKTLRGKLRELAARKKGLEFMRLLAQKRAKEHAKDLGYLYVDGHVRVYSGEVTLPKTYVMQRRLAMPGTTEYWVGDMKGQPLLVITAEANEGMTKMLPLVLKEVRAVVGTRRVTIVFDRGGWSPKLFKTLIEDKWDILTYRKGKTRRVALCAFQEHMATIDGRKVSYRLADKRVRFLGGKLKLRQITMLGEDGYQTNILTNKKGVPPPELAYYMFNRWRQENFFKYMEAEFALDALVEYGTEEADPGRMVPNPKRKAIDKELRAARLAVAELERKLGAAAFENKEEQRRTVRGFKIANGGAIGKPLRGALAKVQSIKERRTSIPVRVTISEALKDKPVRLRTEAKRLSDTFKIIAYQAETALVDLLRPHYSRAEDEGRALIAGALQSAADLRLNEGELCVRLAAQSSPHRTRAIHGVCVELNKIGACFPGTNLRLRYEVVSTEVSPWRKRAGQGP